jgi:hypothetical protein
MPSLGRALQAPVPEWPDIRSECAWLPPHEDATVWCTSGRRLYEHSGVVYTSLGRSHYRYVLAGSTIVSGGDVISWMRVRQPTGGVGDLPGPGTD